MYKQFFEALSNEKKYYQPVMFYTVRFRFFPMNVKGRLKKTVRYLLATIGKHVTTITSN